VVALSRLLDVGVDEERVHFGMNVLDHDLESVKASSFRDLDLVGEALEEVLVDDAVRGGKEGEDVGDEEALVLGEAVLPVVHVLGEVDLLGGPEGGLGLLVHLPDLVEFDGEEDEAARIGLEEGLVVLADLEVGHLGGEAGSDLEISVVGLGGHLIGLVSAVEEVGERVNDSSETECEREEKERLGNVGKREERRERECLNGDK